MDYSHETFISPYTWRYGSEEMKNVFSEVNKRKLLRRVWIALATAQMKAGLVTKKQVEELIAHKDDIDIDRATEIEREIKHDLMAEIKTYAEQCPLAGGIIHLGATSMDALLMPMRESRDIQGCPDDGIYPYPASRDYDNRIPSGPNHPGFKR